MIKRIRGLLLIVITSHGLLIYTAHSRRPHDEAERLCVEFMSDNRLGERPAIEVCADTLMHRAFISPVSARAFNRCWGFFAARRVGRRATPYELAHAPSVLCRGSSQNTALLDGFRGEGYIDFAECLESANSFSDADVARCTNSLRSVHDTNRGKSPTPPSSAKSAGSAE